MKGLFKQKPRPPVEVMRQMQELLIEVDKHWNSRDPKRGEKMVELSKLLRELTAILFGTGNMVPTSETCIQLALEFFKENTMRLVIFYLPKLNSEACRDAALIVSRLQREQVDSRFISTDYLEANKDLMDHLISGFADLDLSLHFGAILRDCIRLQSMARYVLESDGMKKFFEYLQIPNFDIASDAFATFKELITRHKSTVADFLSKRYDWFFTEFNSQLLESKNYMTKRQATRLLAVVLMERSNAGTMIRYVSSKDNLRLIMNLLRETSKTIQVEAFHIFKLFVTNQNKPQEIIAILVANKAKFLRLLAALKTEKEDEMFEEDKQLVMKEIECLESRYRS